MRENLGLPIPTVRSGSWFVVSHKEKSWVFSNRRKQGTEVHRHTSTTKLLQTKNPQGGQVNTSNETGKGNYLILSFLKSFSTPSIRD